MPKRIGKKDVYKRQIIAHPKSPVGLCRRGIAAGVPRQRNRMRNNVRKGAVRPKTARAGFAFPLGKAFEVIIAHPRCV